MTWQLWVAWVLIFANLLLVIANMKLLQRNIRQRLSLERLAADLEKVSRWMP